MITRNIDVLGIGNAIVDILVHVDDEFLSQEGLEKGTMALIDKDVAADLCKKLGPAVKCSGGSVANTIAGLASLGSKVAFIGKIRDDDLGNIFRNDIRGLGVNFDTLPALNGPATATSIVLVTPDAERTMQTYLGACTDLCIEDIDEDQIKASAVTYLEGYLWDPPAAKMALVKASQIAHATNRKVALSLSDPFCVDRHRRDFRDLVANHIDILFANEEEIISLFEARDFESALQNVRGQCEVIALTRGAAGSVVMSRDEVFAIGVSPVKRLIDTTGAGDAYAAGFLWGLSQGIELKRCASLGNSVASEVIQHLGARPNQSVASLAPQPLGPS